MFKQIVKIGVACLICGVTWAANLPPSENPKPPGTKKCCPDDTDPGCNDCVSYSFQFGRTIDSVGLPGGTFSIYTLRPNLNIFTPAGLQYYQPLLTQVIKTTSATHGLEIQIMGQNREAETFLVKKGECIGFPTAQIAAKNNKNLLLLDAGGQPTSSSPVIYRLQYPNGSALNYSVSSGLATTFVSATGRSFSLNSPSIRIEPVYGANGLLQVFSAIDGLADIQVTQKELGYILAYEIRLYAPSQVGERGVDGRYAFTGSPHTVYRIQNPSHPEIIPPPPPPPKDENEEQSTGEDNGEEHAVMHPDEQEPNVKPPDTRTVIISKIAGGVEKVTTYTYSDTLDDWVMEGAGGERKVSRSKSWNSNQTEYTELMQVTGGSGGVSYQETTKIKKFPFGEMLIEKIVGTGDNAIKTWYTYYTSSNQPGYGKLESERHSSGMWKKYFYDNQERTTMIVSPFKDQEFNTPREQAKVEYFLYTPVDPRDVPFLGDQRPRVKETRIGGIIVKKEYFVYYTDENGEDVEIHEQCQLTTAEYGNASNARSVTRYYAKNADPASAGRVKYIQYPNGLQDSYSYAYGNYSLAVQPGNSSFTVNSSGFSLQTTVTYGTVEHPNGVAFKSTKEEKVEDAFGNQVMAREYVCTDAESPTFEEIFWSIATYNEQHQKLNTYNSRNEETNTTWNCCTKESYKDESGIQYTYTYNDLGRLITSVKVGYDSQSNLTTMYVYNSNGKLLSEIKTGNSLTLAKSYQYDLAGRKISEIMENELTTNFSYGAQMITKELPGGATEITTFFADGKNKSITGTASVNSFHDYGIENNHYWEKTTVGTIDGAQWKKNYFDLVGRQIIIEKSSFNNTVQVTNRNYDTRGNLIKISTGETVDEIYEYNDLNQIVRMGYDTDNNGILEVASLDRILDSDLKYAKLNNAWWSHYKEITYPIDNSTVEKVIKQTKNRLNNFPADITSETEDYDVAGNKTITTIQINRLTKSKTTLLRTPFSTAAQKEVSVNGLLATSIDSSNNSYSYEYDSLERPRIFHDSRIGDYTFSYYLFGSGSKGQLMKIVTPDGHCQESGYDTATGRRIWNKNVLGLYTYWTYNLQGQVTNVWGDSDYPISYEYNNLGKIISQITYKGSEYFNNSSFPEIQNGNKEQTTFIYDAASGLLKNKIDPLSNEITFLYSKSGKILQRSLSRTDVNGQNIFVSYSYNNYDDISRIQYSDSTPEVTFEYNRLGQPSKVIDAAGTRAFSYNANLQLQDENISGIYSINLNRLYSPDTGIYLGLQHNSGYEYDTFGRINTITTEQGNFNFTRLPNSNLIMEMQRPNGVMTKWDFEDNSNQISKIENIKNIILQSAYEYQYDPMGRLLNVQTSKSNQLSLQNDVFEYDSKGEITSANLNSQFLYQYQYDNIGNRVYYNTTNLVAGHTETTNYESNVLNQYTELHEGANETSFLYDSAGNMLNDGTWNMTWNADNRLIAMEKTGLKLEFGYDYKGRRIYKKVFESNTLTQHIKFVYDNDKIIIEMDGNNSDSIFKKHVWLPAHMGTQVPLMTSLPNSGTIYYYHIDNNKNVRELTDEAGSVIASYDYSPYGKITNKSETQDVTNNFFFSSEYYDNETQLIAYKFRFYNPRLGRWLSKDIIGERGGIALYNFCHNAPTYMTDALGLACQSFSRTINVQMPSKSFGIFPWSVQFSFNVSTSISAEFCDECCSPERTAVLKKFGAGATFGGSITGAFGFNKEIPLGSDTDKKANVFLGIRATGAANGSVSAAWDEEGCDNLKYASKVCVNTDFSGTLSGGGELSIQYAWWSWSLSATVNGSISLPCEACFNVGGGSISYADSSCGDFKLKAWTEVCIGTCWTFMLYDN